MNNGNNIVQGSWVLFGLAVCCSLLLGCTGTHAAHVAEINKLIPENFTNSSVEDKNPLPETFHAWWHSFEDEQLNTIVDEVFAHNQNLKVAYSRLLQLQAKEREAESSLWPSLGVGGNINRSQRNTQAFSQSFLSNSGGPSGASSLTTTTYSVSAPVQYEVDLWGRIRLQSEAAEKDTQASAFDAYASFMTLAAETVDNYYLVIELCNQLELLKQTIAYDKSFYDIVQKRYADGVADPLDVYQAKQNLSARNAEAPRFRVQLTRAQYNLATLLGRYPSEVVSCESHTLPSPKPLPSGIPSELLVRRPDVRAQLLRLEASDARYASSVRNYFPSLTLSGSSGYEDLDFSDLFHPETFVWRALGDLGVTLFDGGRRQAQVDFQHGVLAAASAEYANTVLAAYMEAEHGLYSQHQLQERINLLEKKVEAVRRTLRLSTEQYLQGVKDYLPVLLAQSTYYAARAELLSARREMISTHIQLARALGGGWSETVVAEHLAAWKDEIEGS